jgi:N-acetyl-gamma-glutamyl-phosphate reductase
MAARPRIYIDGQAGTAALRIREWLADRSDLELVTLPDALRKDPSRRRGCVLDSDVTVLCLPDDAAREAAAWAADAPTRIIDASTAHRTAAGWVYGLPELAPTQREAIRMARLVSNPGCYAAAFLLLLRPLVEKGLLSADHGPTIHALSGYSGGGRELIERWEDPARGLDRLPYEAPYALTRVHKHVPEMRMHAGLRAEPQFLPAVGPFRCGMRLQVALPASVLSNAALGKDVWELLSERYAGEPFVRVAPLAAPAEPDERIFDPRTCNDTNRIELHVLPHPSGHLLLIALLDNLGKGAAGVAIQNLNLVLGLPETTGLPR